jgi:glycosyltransferase involved in cell wall biosynthesis
MALPEFVEAGDDKELLGFKIFHICALAVSARQFLTPHFQALHQQGATQALVCSKGDVGEQVATQNGMTFFPVPINQSITPISDITAVFKLRRLFLKEGPDLVVAHMSKAAVVSLLAAKLGRVRNRVYYNHGMALFSSTGLKRYLLWAVEFISCRLATEVIFCGDSTKDTARSIGLLGKNKGSKVGSGTISGVDTELFYPRKEEEKESARAALGIPSSVVAVGFVGRQVPHKGIATLLESWRLLDDEVRQKARLIFVGGMPTSEIKEMLSDAIVADKTIICLGIRNDMPMVYSAMDVAVLPSWHEGFPYSLLEAQSSGLATIASKVTGNIDAIAPEINGILVPVKDPRSLSIAINRLIVDKENRELLGKNARSIVVKNFDRRLVIENHLKIYQQYCQKKIVTEIKGFKKMM